MNTDIKKALFFYKYEDLRHRFVLATRIRFITYIFFFFHFKIQCVFKEHFKLLCNLDRYTPHPQKKKEENV